MDNYLKHGQVAAWPFLRVLQEMIRIECALDAGLVKLEHRLKSVSSGFENDDIDALSSSAHRVSMLGLKEKVGFLELENKQLRQQVMRLQRSMDDSFSPKCQVGDLQLLYKDDEAIN